MQRFNKQYPRFFDWMIACSMLLLGVGRVPPLFFFIKNDEKGDRKGRASEGTLVPSNIEHLSVFG